MIAKASEACLKLFREKGTRFPSKLSSKFTIKTCKNILSGNRQNDKLVCLTGV